VGQGAGCRGEMVNRAPSGTHTYKLGPLSTNTKHSPLYVRCSGARQAWGPGGSAGGDGEIPSKSAWAADWPDNFFNMISFSNYTLDKRT